MPLKITIASDLNDIVSILCAGKVRFRTVMKSVQGQVIKGYFRDFSTKLPDSKVVIFTKSWVQSFGILGKKAGLG